MPCRAGARSPLLLSESGIVLPRFVQIQPLTAQASNVKTCFPGKGIPDQLHDNEFDNERHGDHDVGWGRPSHAHSPRPG